LIVWRLAPRRHASRPDGAGNRDRGALELGPRAGVVYTSLNVATCVLETLIHFGPTLRAKFPGRLQYRYCC
jgi:RES domain-containing protein